MWEEEDGEHSGRGAQRKAWMSWQQSVIEIEARRFMVIGVCGVGGRGVGERREERGSKSKMGAMRRVRLSKTEPGGNGGAGRSKTWVAGPGTMRVRFEVQQEPSTGEGV